MSKIVKTEYTIAVGAEKLPRPIRIAHLSDIHERNCDAFLPMIREEKPDLIMVTGDVLERYDNRPEYDVYRRPIKKCIITMMHLINYTVMCMLPKSKKADIENARRFLREAVRIAPVYMSMGNHEQKLLDKDYRFLRSIGVTLLDNADTQVSVKGFRFTLGGMSCWDYEEWLPTFLKKSGYKILLCHRPDQYMKYVAGSGVDLTLSGHTHGGQVGLGKRGRGLLVPGQGIFGRYAHGCFDDGRLIISAGCSNTVACPRINNPRELVMIDLR